MQTLKIIVMAFLSRDEKEGIIKYCCRYPYAASEHQKLLGILYIFSIFMSFMYFLTFEIFGSSNMFKLSLPEVAMNPYLQNRTELYGTAMKEMPYQHTVLKAPSLPCRRALSRRSGNNSKLKYSLLLR